MCSKHVNYFKFNGEHHHWEDLCNNFRISDHETSKDNLCDSLELLTRLDNLQSTYSPKLSAKLEVLKGGPETYLPYT